LREARVVLRSLKAEARVEVRQRERRFRFHASILAEHPGRLYVETSGFGLSAAVLSVAGEKALVYLPSRGRAYHADPEKILGRLLGIEQSSREWVDFLLGGLPPYEEPVVSAQDIGEETVLGLGKSDPRLFLTFDRETSWLRSFRESSPRNRTLSFGDPRETPAGNFPSELRIEAPGDRSVFLRFEKVVVNAKVTPELLRIELPVGLEPSPMGDAELLLGE
jgi:hypothetical protein